MNSTFNERQLFGDDVKILYKSHTDIGRYNRQMDKHKMAFDVRTK